MGSSLVAMVEVTMVGIAMVEVAMVEVPMVEAAMVGVAVVEVAMFEVLQWLRSPVSGKDNGWDQKVQPLPEHGSLEPAPLLARIRILLLVQSTASSPAW